MAQRDVITEEILQAAIAVLDTRIVTPAPPNEKRYSRREAFLKLRAKAKEAIAAGHSLETVLDDLKGVGLGLTLSTARQYLKPGRKTNGRKPATRTELIPKQVSQEAMKTIPIVIEKDGEAKNGTFAVVEDDNEI